MNLYGTDIPEFRPFPKIPRLFRPIIITEKIDGTNASVMVLPDGCVIPASRNRYLTLESDNYGFAAWVKEHEDNLRQLGVGRHFGEWWGKGINRGYGLDHRRFSLFNVGRWYDPETRPGGLTIGDTVARLCPLCCHVVPILFYSLTFDMSRIEIEMGELRARGSKAAPGFMRPEGIVVCHKVGNVLFKVTLENDSEPKSTQ